MNRSKRSSLIATTSIVIAGLTLGWLLPDPSAPEAPPLQVARKEVVPMRGGISFTALPKGRLLAADAATTEPTTMTAEALPWEEQGVVTVHLSDAATGDPAPGYEVIVLAPPFEGLPDQKASGESDHEGAFATALRIPVPSMSVHVRSTATNSTIATWTGPFQSDVDIEMQPASMLYCRVQFGADSDRPPAEQCWLTFSRVASGFQAPKLVARAPLQADYTLELPIHLPPEVSRLSVDLSYSGAHLVTTQHSVEDLLDPSGVTLEAEVTSLAITVADSAGAPVAGADLRLGDLEDDGQLATVTSTDPDGRAVLVSRPGRMQACVAAVGFRPWSGEVVVPGPPRGIVLERVDVTDQVEVEVVNLRGEPVTGALVTMTPVTADVDVGIGAAVQGWSDDAGRLTLVRSLEGPARIVAHHPEHGMSPPAIFDSFRGARVRIELEDTAILTLLPSRGAGPGIEGYEEVFWVAYDRFQDRYWSGYLPSYRRTFEPLPLGEHVLSLFVPELGLYAVETVVLTEPGRIPLDVQWRGGYFLDGQLSGPADTASIEEYTVRACSAGPWENAVEPWSTSSVSPLGRFRLFVPGAAEFRLHVLRSGATVLSEDVGANPGELKIALP